MSVMTGFPSGEPGGHLPAFARGQRPGSRLTTEAGFAIDEIKRPETVADGTVGYSTLGCEIAILDPDGNPRLAVRRGMLTAMAAASPAPPGVAPAARPVYWFPLALFA
jgi:hypothetical protein